MIVNHHFHAISTCSKVLISCRSIYLQLFSVSWVFLLYCSTCPLFVSVKIVQLTTVLLALQTVIDHIISMTSIFYSDKASDKVYIWNTQINVWFSLMQLLMFHTTLGSAVYAIVCRLKDSSKTSTNLQVFSNKAEKSGFCYVLKR